jgi:hypothetical protein
MSIFVPVSYIGCKVQPIELAKNMDFLEEGNALLDSFSGELALFFYDRRDEVCGAPSNTNNATVLESLVWRSKDHLCGAAGILRQIRSFFQCENWYPLYRSAVHDAMCYSAIDGFSWIAGTQLVVVVMGVIILTCRVVLSDGAAAVVADGETSGEIQDNFTFDSAAAQGSLSIIAEADDDEAGESVAQKLASIPPDVATTSEVVE